MTILENLPSFVGKYVSVTEPSGDGLNGWVTDALREALDQFIKSVPDRWDRGSEMLEASRHTAYGTNPNR